MQLHTNHNLNNLDHVNTNQYNLVSIWALTIQFILYLMQSQYCVAGTHQKINTDRCQQLMLVTTKSKPGFDWQVQTKLLMLQQSFRNCLISFLFLYSLCSFWSSGVKILGQIVFQNGFSSPPGPQRTHFSGAFCEPKKQMFIFCGAIEYKNTIFPIQ